MPNVEKVRKLKKLVARLYNQIPLMARPLRWTAIWALVKNGSPEALDALADALVHNADPHVGHAALRALQKLAAQGNPGAQDALCRLVVEYQHPLVCTIVFAEAYAPHEPKQRAHFMHTLAERFLRNADSPDGQRFFQALVNIAAAGKSEAQEVLCRLVIDQAQPLAREIVLAAHYAPHDPIQRALLYILTAQWERYDLLDFDHHLLHAAFRASDPALQQRIVTSVRQGGRADLLAAVVAEEQPIDRMTDEDWQTMLTALSDNRAWPELWQMAQAAPLFWSGRLLRRLQEAQWLPSEETERREFTKFVRLAEECQDVATPPVGWVVYCHAALEGHTDDVRCLAISPDGQVLASGGGDKIIHLWDLPDGAALKLRRGQHTLIAPDLPYWEYRRRSELRTLKGHARMVTCLAISPDGQLAATGGGDNLVRLWSLPGGAPLQTLKGHTQAITCLAISPDGRMLVSGSADYTVRLWDLPGGTVFKKLKGFHDDVRCLALSPDGRILASSSQEHVIRLWRLPDGAALHTLEGHTQRITCLAISPDGRILASGSGDNTVRLWRLPDGALLQTLSGHTAGVSCLAISPDGQFLASGSADQTVRLWRLPDGGALKTLHGHTARINCLAISPDGEMLASGGVDRAVRLWVVAPVALSRLSAAQISLKEFDLLRARLQDAEVTDAERRWLALLLALVRWRRRFDVEIGEASREIAIGEFDIAI